MYRCSLSLPALILPALLASLLLGPSARPAAADVSVYGGSPAQREALRRVYDRQIPAAFHTDEALMVELLTDRRMDAAAREDGGAEDDDARDVDGLYDEDTGLIQLRASLPPDELAQTFAHEYGHYVWQTLSLTQRRRYGRLYEAQRDAGHLVSEYASTDRGEGFAEAFAYLATDREALDRRDPASEAFLQGLPAVGTPARLASQAAAGKDAEAATNANDSEGRGWGRHDGGGEHRGHWRPWD